MKLSLDPVIREMDKQAFTVLFCLIWFGLAWFNGILTIVGYLMPNLVYTYILDIYDL